MKMNCLITLLSWNHLPFSQLAIHYLLKNTHGRHQILVVDQGSNKETLEWLRKIRDTGAIELIELEKNIGIGPGMNIGMKLAVERDRDFVFFSNDVVPGANWLENLIEETYSYPTVGMSSPYLAPEATYDEFANMQFREHYRRNVWPRLRNDPKFEELQELIDNLHGGNFQEFTENWSNTRKGIPPLYEIFSMVMYIKKSTIETVGYFDPQFVPSNFEDLDYMVRCNNHNIYRIGATSSYCFHFSNITNRNEFMDNAPEYRREVSENEIRFNKKWKIFLPYNERKHGVPDGDKYPPMGREVPFLPFEVSDKENNRHHNKWPLWEPEKYPDIPQLGRDYFEN